MNHPGLNLYTHEFFPKHGGIATYCHEFAQAAAKIGYISTVFAPSNAKIFEEFDNSYKLVAANWHGNHNLPAILKARRRLRTELQSPQTVHLLAEPAPILAYGSLPETVRLSAPVFLTLHGSEIERWTKHLVSGFLAKRAMASAQQIIAVSHPIAKMARARFPEFADKIKAVPNALPNDLQRTQLPNRTIRNTEMQILSVGRIHPRKGFDQIIKALATLPEALRQQMRYTIIGGQKDDRYLNNLRTAARENNVPLEIKLNAPQSTLIEAYQYADVFALTSMPYRSSVEGFGLVYLEAGAYGLPCLAHDIGGVSDAVIEGTTGHLVPPGNPQMLADILKNWLLQPEIRLQLGRNNRAFALQRTWESVVQESLKT